MKTSSDQGLEIHVTLKFSGGCQERFEAALGRKGWSLPSVGEPPVRGEILQFGGSVLVTGAAHQAERRAVAELHAVAEDAKVEIDSHRVRREDADSPEVTTFAVYRRAEVTDPANRYLALRARLLNFLAIRFGTRDVGFRYSGSYADPVLPPGYSARQGFARRRVSGPSGQAEDTARSGEGVGRLQARSIYFSLIWWAAIFEGGMGLFLHLLRGSSGAGATLVFAVLLAVCAQIVRLTVRMDRPRSAGRGVVVGLLFCLALAGAGASSGLVVSGTAGEGLMPLSLAVFIGTGLWMLLQGWRAAPLMTAVVGLAGVVPVAVLGFFLRGGYLLAFEAEPTAVDVTPFWAAVAALRVLLTASFFLVVPAVIGYLRHFHLLSGDRILRSFVLLEVLVFGLVMLGPDATYLNPSKEAGTAARQLAARGGDPDPYFGINPDWNCVQLLTPPDKVDSDGGIIDPSRPYLVLGASAGRSQLWNGEGRTPISVDDGQVRLLPRKSGRGECHAEP